jgi:hypothetical protein
MIHLESRPARYQPCPHCGHHTLTAQDAGIPVRCDPEPLSINQEIAALLLGRATYDVLVYGLPRRMHPRYRDFGRIRAPRRHAVIADHKCGPGPRPLMRQPETEIVIPFAITATAYGDIPPF